MYILALIYFFISGCIALVYQTLWLKELGLLFGSSSYASAATLSAFFMGMSAGGLFFGGRKQTIKTPLAMYAVAEIGIAVSALLYFVIFDLYAYAYPAVFERFGANSHMFIFVKFILSLGVVFLPAFFMGGTLPSVRHWVPL